MFPCADVLVSLTDWPPFCLDLNSIDIAVFERNMNQLNEFDLVFVLKGKASTERGFVGDMGGGGWIDG